MREDCASSGHRSLERVDRRNAFNVRCDAIPWEDSVKYMYMYG